MDYRGFIEGLYWEVSKVSQDSEARVSALALSWAELVKIQKSVRTQKPVGPQPSWAGKSIWGKTSTDQQELNPSHDETQMSWIMSVSNSRQTTYQSWVSTTFQHCLYKFCEELNIYQFLGSEPFVCFHIVNEQHYNLHCNFVFVFLVQWTTLQSVFRRVSYPDRILENKTHQAWHAPIFCPGGCPSQSIGLVLGLLVRCGKIHIFLSNSRSSGLYHFRFAFD